ncbi:tryptophan synthase subunit alpha [Bacillus suaedaesalsae]|uniref:Tryptophan synthase alpha chain n=1 Tax=Bacillus suaedaesalsae TaxID=2810349 RepID=A0ABS2DMX5_9BACI|nr:tryptophan synthase subunit alpha [Bacillus suaedaesalsae]MBM6619855.1 tryptophan synthase subunit alpha [Bacillus suaedaesalsae]
MNTPLKRTIPKQQFLFIPFIMAGFPDEEITIELALSLQELGASAIELGVPYSDPLADGPVIQQAASKSLKSGMTIQRAMELVGKMRKKGVEIPVILFTYYNPVLQLEEKSFFALMHQNDIDGLLIPDLPHEESQHMRKRCKQEKIMYISLVAPTSDTRIEQIATGAEGFLYCVSSLGVTGVRNELHKDIISFLATVKRHSPIPIAVGFGISSDTQVKELMPLCDGVIVGSALLKKIGELEDLLLNPKTKDQAVYEFKQFVLSIVTPISS